MTATRQLTCTILLALVSISTQADPSQSTLDLTGVITSVSSPPTDHTFMAGQPVSGVLQIDFANASGPPEIGGSPNITIFQGITNYSLTLGNVTMASANPSTGLFTVLNDGGAGLADTMTILDFVPNAQNDPRGASLFDDVTIALTDPTGTGFTTGGQTFDPSKFITGEFFATGGTGFSGDNVEGVVEARSARSVPEPGMLLLLSTGLLALFAWADGCAVPISRVGRLSAG